MTDLRPFFDSGPPERRDGRRLLLLSMHFPPGQSAGARRWEKLSHFAAERGWALDVVCLDPESLPVQDASRLEGLPPGVRVFGVADGTHPLSRALDRLVEALVALRSRRAKRAADEPEGAASPSDAAVDAAISRWVLRGDALAMDWSIRRVRATVEAWLSLQDERVWARRAVALAERLVGVDRPDVIVTCGPEHAIHDVARPLSRRTGIPQVLDLRDPWSRAERAQIDHAAPYFYHRAEAMERRAFRHASLVAMNTPGARDEMQRVHPGLAEKIICVMNGVDAEPIEPREPGGPFVMAYAGAIYGGRTPRMLFRALSRYLADSKPATRFEACPIRIDLMGSFDRAAIAAMAEAEGVADHVRMVDAGPLSAVRALYAGAQLLVNLPQDAHLAVPSKIFEYLAQPAWVLALADPDSATAQVLDGTEADVVAPDDVDALVRVIGNRYEAHRKGECAEPIAKDPRLGRAHQAAVLFDAIDGVLVDAR